jgi:hypothetical protein
MRGEVGFVAAVEANLTDDGAVGLKLGPSVARSLVHFVVSGPAELNGVAVAGSRIAPVTQPKANSPPPLPLKRM